MPDIDLDAARAARAEAHGEPKTLLFGGETFILPVECPFTFVEALNAGEDRLSVMALFREDTERFMALEPTFDDMKALIEGVAETYGLRTPGNSSTSNGSSPNGSRRSKRTS